jgi:hypothetical protein
MERYLAILLIAGLAVAAIGFLWLVGVGFRTRRAWGVGLLLFPPLALVFIARNFRRAFAPMFLLLLGGGLIAAPYVVNFAVEHWVDLGPRERVVDGELHITLTGWEQNNYDVLRARPTTVVLQMANADVSDATLEHLRELPLLRELDLNDTRITDAGLATLAELPALETLRLRKTKITDAGFKQHLFDRERLIELDLTGTEVASATVRAWKKLKEGRKALK